MLPDIGYALKVLLVVSAVGVLSMLGWAVAGAFWLFEHVRIAP